MAPSPPAPHACPPPGRRQAGGRQTRPWGARACLADPAPSTLMKTHPKMLCTGLAALQRDPTLPPPAPACIHTHSHSHTAVAVPPKPGEHFPDQRTVMKSKGLLLLCPSTALLEPRALEATGAGRRRGLPAKLVRRGSQELGAGTASPQLCRRAGHWNSPFGGGRSGEGRLSPSLPWGEESILLSGVWGHARLAS